MGHGGVLYSRELPGGGYVVIEAVPPEPVSPQSVTPDSTPATAAPQGGSSQGIDLVRCVLRVERRADPARRSGHRPPVLVEATGQTPDFALNELVPIARDNVEVARAIRAWQQRKWKNSRVN